MIGGKPPEGIIFGWGAWPQPITFPFYDFASAFDFIEKPKPVPDSLQNIMQGKNP